MMKNRWRNVRRRSSNGNSSSVGSSSASGSSFDSTNTELNAKTIDPLVNHVQLPKGCLKGQSDDLLKLYDKKLMGSKRQPRIRKFVTFQHVFIREYERTIGDNPSCSKGAPVRYVIGNDIGD
jgi:hypothetical protein